MNKKVDNKQRKSRRDKCMKYIDFTIGLILVSLAFNVFFLNYDIVYGVSGIGIMLNHIFGVEPSIVIFIGSIILLFFSFILLGKEKTKNSVLGSILYPVFVELTSFIIPLINITEVEKIVAVGIGAILSGIGYGLIYRAGFTTGGSDILSQIISKYLKMTIGNAMLIGDGIIILSSMFVFGLNGVIYSLLAILIISFISDRVMIGIGKAKAFYIITENEEEVIKFFVTHLSHGVTVLDVTGGYTSSPKRMIMCIIPTREYVFAKEAIKSIDENAFLIITEAYEVSGGEYN